MNTTTPHRPATALILMFVTCLYVAGCSGSRMSGEASWYGGQYHGRTTASGEPFNKEALTAAHKDLPFQSRVEVTNRENGRRVIVRINDRFPGTKGRVIDLSEGSFRRLAPIERGVIPVELEVVDHP